MKIRSVNPYNEEVNGEFDLLTFEETKEEIGRSRAAFNSWKRTSVSERVEFLIDVARDLREMKAEYAEIITKEVGKLIGQ